MCDLCQGQYSKLMINQGITFGLWQEVPLWLLVVVWTGTLLFALKERELWRACGLYAILLGGGFNLLSRIRYGGVVDNLNFLGLVYNNGADYLIFFGLVIYGYTYFVRRQ